MTCDTCLGTGFLVVKGDTPKSAYVITRLIPCPECGGDGITSCCEGTERDFDD